MKKQISIHPKIQSALIRDACSSTAKARSVRVIRVPSRTKPSKAQRSHADPTNLSYKIHQQKPFFSLTFHNFFLFLDYKAKTTCNS